MSTRRPHEANPEFVNTTRSQWPGSERPGRSVLMWFGEGRVVGLSSVGETVGCTCYCGARWWCPLPRRLCGWVRAVANSAATSGSM
jgi:hypothetical protein